MDDSVFGMLVTLIRRMGKKISAGLGDFDSIVLAAGSAVEFQADSRYWTYGLIRDVFGNDFRHRFRVALGEAFQVDPDFEDAHYLLLNGDGESSGLRFDVDNRVALVGFLNLTEVDKELVRSMAGKPVSLTSVLGVPDGVTAQDYAAAWAWHLRSEVVVSVGGRLNTAVAAVVEKLRNESMSDAQVVSEFSGLFLASGGE